MIVPVLHRIVLKQDVLEEKDEIFKRAKQAGIDIQFADERKREQAAIDTAEVVAIGPTAFRDFGVDEAPIVVGSRIWFAKHAGKTVVDPDTEETFVVINDEDVICLFTKEGA